MAALTIATLANTTPLARRVNAEVSSLRETRSRLAGLRLDLEALFERVGFDPRDPRDPAAAVAVAAALGMPSPDHLEPALVALQELAALELTRPLSRLTSPVG